ncbi:4-alpha-glucanotransferase [Ectopseudomonas oleovorans]|uniref:4-alpha-glucanotransferase n=1 Tax=Ectopseudomonas oleovorans TaxID=301 RepID=A0A397NEM1_ECTOL|nr:4-alpha-glucanotransferase [Pseudomonas oleovorans]RIA35972.1 4-alpha-glucanotransferase [Pseudomonas oleovorans]
MSDRLLAELAEAADLCIDWIDAHGRPQHVSPEAQRSLLEALGYPAQSSEQLRASLAAVGQSRHVPGDANLLFQDQGQSLPLTLYPADSLYRLIDEQGTVSEGRLDGDGRLPAQHRTGYYQLEIRDSQHPLAVAPAACLSVQQLCGKPRIWGLTAQLYGLRRKGDGGLGDTLAVADLARHAANHGADAIALSPVHAQFSVDVQRFGPYSPSSRLFFNTLYAAPVTLLGSERLQRAVNAARLQDDMARLEALELIDWPAVAQARQRLLRQLYEDFCQAPGQLLERFEAFRTVGGEALQQHCCFEAIHGQRLREGASGDWRTWPEALRNPTQGAVTRFAVKHGEELRYHAFCQWLIAHGLESAQSTASGAGMGIGLIADLAVGADCAGSQAWSRQDELLPSVTVGAPPDILNRQGQNWGVSAFSPQGLRQHGFRAYIEMLQANLAHAGGIRIDHVMGLQRLWVIPQGAEPQYGAYLRYPLDDLLRLLALESHRHRALVIGEDLGTVPDGLREKLAARNILGTRVLLFEQDDIGFVPAARWPGNALATTTTHDLPTIKGWLTGRDLEWRVRAGQRDAELLEGDHAERAGERVALRQLLERQGSVSGTEDDACLLACIDHIGRTPSALALLPLEDACGLEQQPNLPGPGDVHPNWRRRYPLPVNELLEQPATSQRLARLDRARQEAGND